MGLDRIPVTQAERDAKRLEQLWERESAILVAIETSRRWRAAQAVLAPVTLLLVGAVSPLLIDERSFSLLDLVGLAAEGDFIGELATFGGWTLWLLLFAVIGALVAAFHLAVPPSGRWVAAAGVLTGLVVLLVLVLAAVAGGLTSRSDDVAVLFTPGALCLLTGVAWLFTGTLLRRRDR